MHFGRSESTSPNPERIIKLLELFGNVQPEEVRAIVAGQISSFSSRQRLELIQTLALNLHTLPNQAEVHARSKRREELIASQKQLLTFINQLWDGDIVEVLRKTFVLFSKIADPELIRKRGTSEIGMVPVVRRIDEFFIDIYSHLLIIRESLRQLRLLKDSLETKGYWDLLEATPPTTSAVEALEKETRTYWEVARLFTEDRQKFIDLTSNISRDIRNICNAFEALYGDAKSPNFKDIPFIQGNGLLTHVLDMYVERLPLAVDQPADPSEVSSGNEVDLIAHNFLLLADPKLVALIKSQQAFAPLGELIAKIYGVYETIRTCAEPFVNMKEEESLVGKIKNSVESEKGSDTERVNTTVNYLKHLDFSAIPQRIRVQKKLGGKTLSVRHKKLLDIFQAIYDKLQGLASSQTSVDPDSELREFVQELLQAKTQFQLEGTNPIDIMRDEQEGNICYEPEIVDIGMLQLRRSYSDGTSLDEVIGASWREIRTDIESILLDEQFGSVYSLGHPRGRARNNTLVIGPYGCGKNTFLRALSADSRVISINMTTDRIMNPYIGEAEANVRRVFELSERQVSEYGKPAVIGWDEFDTLFSTSSNGTDVGSQVRKAMQKALQSVLDGDRIYNGVSLIGLTNEPDQIPVAVYRRFANVRVINPLTETEHIQLLQNFLGSLPLSESFDKDLNWHNFAQRFEHASGDIIGKVIDQVFDLFVSEFRTKNQDKLREVNNQLKDIKKRGERITPAMRRELYHAADPTMIVTPGMLETAAEIVLSKQEIQLALQNQVDFYASVHQLLAKAFKKK